MKFSLACGGTLALLCAVHSASAQAPSAPTQSTQDQQTQPAPPARGQVIFSRSIDENGQTTTHAGPAAQTTALHAASEPAMDDAEREAVNVTAMDLDVRLHPADRHLAVRALITVRNDGSKPLTRIPLQISSALDWERLRVEGKDAAAAIATLNSDTDHTGQLHEAEIPLAAPLAPGQSLHIDGTYGGSVAPSAQRLTALGTPSDLALHSDWDEISTPFTGLRGFGNVVWYPVSSVPVLLGDGARLFNAVGMHKLRLSAAHLRVRLTVEFPYGQAPTVAIIDGVSIPLNVASQGSLDPDSDGVATANFDVPQIGFEAPSLFVAQRKPHAGPGFTAWTLSENEVAIQAWTTAAQAVTPLLADWLGKAPRMELTLLDLPDPNDATFETGSLLAVSLHESSADNLEAAMVHALAHAWIPSPHAWVSEGVASFMGSLWIEKRHGRELALETLESSRSALALEEPSSPGESPGQPLSIAIAPIYYRTKASYIFWMLRDLIGDDALAQAFQSYAPQQDAAPATGPGAQPRAGELEDLLRKAAAASNKDLGWLFSDWIDADKGLPDLNIDSVFSEPAQAGTWLVGINVSNAGYAAANVPVTVRAGKTTATDRVLIPARGKLSHRMLVATTPTQVQLNDGVTPEVQSSVHETNLETPASSTPQTQQTPGGATQPPLPMTGNPPRP